MRLVSLDQPFQWVQVEFKVSCNSKVTRDQWWDQWWISIGHSHGTHLFDFSRWYWQDRAKEHVRNDESLRRTLHKRLHEERGKVGTSSVRSQLSEFLNLGSSSIPLSRSRFKPSQRGFGFKLFRSIWFRMILMQFIPFFPLFPFCLPRFASQILEQERLHRWPHCPSPYGDRAAWEAQCRHNQLLLRLACPADPSKSFKQLEIK